MMHHHVIEQQDAFGASKASERAHRVRRVGLKTSTCAAYKATRMTGEVAFNLTGFERFELAAGVGPTPPLFASVTGGAPHEVVSNVCAARGKRVATVPPPSPPSKWRVAAGNLAAGATAGCAVAAPAGARSAAAAPRPPHFAPSADLPDF